MVIAGDLFSLKDDQIVTVGIADDEFAVAPGLILRLGRGL